MTDPVYPLNPRADRERLVLAMHRVLGNRAAAPCDLPNCRRGMLIGEPRLILTASDIREPVALDDLLPMARRKRASLLCGYIDPHKPGHGFTFDVVMRDEEGFRLIPACKLWLPRAGWPWLIPDAGTDAVTLTKRKLIATARRPWHDKFGRTVGLTRGLTSLWAAASITPNEHWADY